MNHCVKNYWKLRNCHTRTTEYDATRAENDTIRAENDATTAEYEVTAAENDATTNSIK